MDNNYGCDLVKMGNHIAELRKERGLTQKKLAELIDVNDKSISKWEQGNLAPDITVLKPLADTLGVTLDEILCGETLEEIEKKKRKSEPLLVKIKRLKSRIFAYIMTVLAMSLIIIVMRQNEWKVSDFSYNNKISVEGVWASNSNNAKLFFYNFYYKDDDYEEIKLKDCLIKILENDTLIYSQTINKTEYITFDIFLKELYLKINTSRKIEKDDLIMELSFLDEAGYEHYYELHF